jgi:nicotinamide phosphoribosyltransferase
MNIDNLLENVIINTDSYKVCHWVFLEKRTNRIAAYVEPRVGGEYDETVFFGLQIYLKKYLTLRVTQFMIDQADEFLTAHGEPFNRKMWQYVLDKHDGRFPLVVKALPEGIIVPNGTAVLTVENTDPNIDFEDDDIGAALATYIETQILRAGWYGSSVATQSHEMISVYREFLEKTGDPSLDMFGLIDFGARGASSFESASIGGAAHQVCGNYGTDNLIGIAAAMVYYNTTDITAYSIPATEHSVTTLWGQDHELDFFRHIIKNVLSKYPFVSVVIDTYDMKKAIKMWGTTLKDELIATGHTVRLRPDSGVPYKVVLQTVKLLDKYFGSTVNSKGYKVLHPSVRVIQGDGITRDMMRKILQVLMDNGYSADNVNFGSGGALLQKVTRDTQRFAMKGSYAEVDGKGRVTRKNPKTDPSKASKGGLLETVRRDGKIVTVTVEQVLTTDEKLFQEVFRDGVVTKEYTFAEVRNNYKEAIANKKAMALVA